MKKVKKTLRNQFISYQLLIKVSRICRVRIGKLGTFHFRKGWYVYTGSARNNPSARINRHLSKNKKLRWHIDYLLTDPSVQVVGIKISSVPECELNCNTPGSVPVPGFGSSDCKKKCGSHLKYLKQTGEITPEEGFLPPEACSLRG